MFKPYRSTPLEGAKELHDIYGTQDSSAIPFLHLLNLTKDKIRSLITENDLTKGGLVVSVEGTWGSGKTSFVDLLCQETEDLNVAIVRYDSLYYGNASEATDIFIKDIFDTVQERFGVKLASGSSIAKNITPKFEFSGGIPKFTLDYSVSRAPTETIIKDKLKHKLASLSGKMVVVIDDIDRAPAGDVIHFLRLIRVLRELPNFIIIMPVDGAVLENLLRTNGIENPRAYLQKIVDYPIDLTPKQGESKDLFFSLLRRRYSDENLSDEFCHRAWDLYLWEISLVVIQQYETRGGDRLTLNADPNNSLWQLVRGADSKTGQNLVRKFFELTSVAYGASSNYVFRLSNSGSTRRDIFQHYSILFVNMTFTDLMYARLFPSVAYPQAFSLPQGAMPTTMEWWDASNIAPLGSQNGNDYTIKIPLSEDESQRQAYYAQIKGHRHIVWDTVRGLAGSCLPERAFQFLTPRTLNRIISQLELTPISYQASTSTEDYAELHRQIREVVQRTIIFNP